MMLTRREFLSTAAALPLAAAEARSADGVVNDVQAQLNETRVTRVEKPDSLDALEAVLRRAKDDGKPVSVCGGRHAMGGQQFGTDTVLIDVRGLNRVVALDEAKGEIEVEAGVEWPELLAHLHRAQAGRPWTWSVRQKQTGVDRVTMAGTLAANAHGRGLRFPPFVADVESFVLLDADGKARTCSRRENAELFSLAVGGYGLFGVVARVRLRLARRTKVRREVKVVAVRDLLAGVEDRVKDGFVYGDCQYSTDLDGDAGGHPGVFSCYKPAPDDTPVPEVQKHLTAEAWAELYRLARTDRKKAFETYSQYYLGTSGQVYWSDTHQLSGRLDMAAAAKALNQPVRGTEMITEVYVRPDDLVPFLAKARQDFLDHNVDLTYGTIRFIEKDDTTFLAWAKERQVCVLCNLHVTHTDTGKKKAAEDLRRLIGRAAEFGGRYFLTYHRWATHEQVETCYPQMAEFLKLKRKYDPQERFQSDWYRHYKAMFADKL
jgi:FAD/FMN-containing dehydrogenase